MTSRRILVTGLVTARDVVAALPKLAFLRQSEPESHITLRVPASAVDLVERLRLCDAGLRQEDHSAVVWLWRQWRGGFDAVIDAVQIADETPVTLERLQDDLSFLLPEAPFVVISPSRRVPAVRMGSLAARLLREGRNVVLVEGDTDGPWRNAFCRVAAECRDLSGRIGLAEAPSLARLCDAWLGGNDAATRLAAMAAVKTVLMSEGDDAGLRKLPANATWLQVDDLSLLGVADMMRQL